MWSDKQRDWRQRQKNKTLANVNNIIRKQGVRSRNQEMNVVLIVI